MVYKVHKVFKVHRVYKVFRVYKVYKVSALYGKVIMTPLLNINKMMWFTTMVVALLLYGQLIFMILKAVSLVVKFQKLLEHMVNLAH